MEEAHPAPGDLFVILELGLKMDWPLVEKLRSRGVIVGGVVYDLEPVRNPQFFPENTVNRFPAWLKAIGTHYDFALTISQTVGGHLQQYYRDNLIATRLTNDRIVAFRLGSELDGVAAAELKKNSVRPELIQQLEDNTRPTLLNVGTIEPRKNHTLLLDAFDNALARGADVCCLIVGVIGWKCEDVVQRMQSHPERGRRLLVYHDLNDEELKYVYSQADALAYTTHAEGYGLPVTEAMLAGLPVIANDLPVLRETSGNQAVFLSPTDVEAWGAAFQQFALGELKFPPPNDSHTVAISWRESTQRFLNQIINLTNTFASEDELSTPRAKSA
ncbi:MAG: glycosyltransferase [Planctomycetaceae bacterium]|nr:glycosyltransferase [Planctomycetaceae bacterium]